MIIVKIFKSFYIEFCFLCILNLSFLSVAYSTDAAEAKSTSHGSFHSASPGPQNDTPDGTKDGTDTEYPYTTNCDPTFIPPFPVSLLDEQDKKRKGDLSSGDKKFLEELSSQIERFHKLILEERGVYQNAEEEKSKFYKSINGLSSELKNSIKELSSLIGEFSKAFSCELETSCQRLKQLMDRERNIHMEKKYMELGIYEHMQRRSHHELPDQNQIQNEHSEENQPLWKNFEEILKKTKDRMEEAAAKGAKLAQDLIEKDRAEISAEKELQDFVESLHQEETKEEMKEEQSDSLDEGEGEGEDDEEEIYPSTTPFGLPSKKPEKKERDQYGFSGGNPPSFPASLGLSPAKVIGPGELESTSSGYAHVKGPHEPESDAGLEDELKRLRQTIEAQQKMIQLQLEIMRIQQERIRDYSFMISGNPASSSATSSIVPISAMGSAEHGSDVVLATSGTSSAFMQNRRFKVSDLGVSLGDVQFIFDTLAELKTSQRSTLPFLMERQSEENVVVPLSYTNSNAGRPPRIFEEDIPSSYPQVQSTSGDMTDSMQPTPPVTVSQDFHSQELSVTDMSYSIGTPFPLPTGETRVIVSDQSLNINADELASNYSQGSNGSFKSQVSHYYSQIGDYAVDDYQSTPVTETVTATVVATEESSLN